MSYALAPSSHVPCPTSHAPHMPMPPSWDAFTRPPLACPTHAYILGCLYMPSSRMPHTCLYPAGSVAVWPRAERGQLEGTCERRACKGIPGLLASAPTLGPAWCRSSNSGWKASMWRASRCRGAMVQGCNGAGALLLRYLSYCGCYIILSA